MKRHARKSHRNLSPVQVFFADKRNRDISRLWTLSERDYVEFLLRVVNTGKITPWDLVVLRANGMDPPDEWTEAVPSSWPGNLVDDFKQQLTLVHGNPSAAARLVPPLVQRLVGRILLVPLAESPTFTAGRTPTAGAPIEPIEMTYLPRCADEHAGLEYAELILITKFAKDLCRCRLPSCGIFFLAERAPRGRIRREYCTPAHRKERFAAEGADRVRASRARLSIEEWRRKRQPRESK
jgi:hypothetical protein